MDIQAFAEEYAEDRPGHLLSPEQTLAACIAATRFYAGYGDIRSVSKSDTLLGAAGPDADRPGPQDPELDILPALPIKSAALIVETTVLTIGEWAIIRPLFVLYVDRENALLLEASRGMGIDPYGRSVSELAMDIAAMETEILPGKAFQYAIVTV